MPEMTSTGWPRARAACSRKRSARRALRSVLVPTTRTRPARMLRNRSPKRAEAIEGALLARRIEAIAVIEAGRQPDAIRAAGP